MDSKKIKGIVFDKDGTLIDFEKSWYPLLREFVLNLADGDIDTARRMFSQCGADLDTQEFKSGSTLGAGTNEEIVAVWANILELNKAESIALEKKFNQTLKEKMSDYVHPITCLKTLFTELQSMGIICGIATMDSKESLESCVKNLDIYDVCTYRVGYDSGFGQKPQGGMVLGFCKEHNLHPSEVIVVGDNTHDIHMGKNAGAFCTIGVLTGNSQSDDLFEADYILPDITHIPNFLKETL